MSRRINTRKKVKCSFKHAKEQETSFHVKPVDVAIHFTLANQRSYPSSCWWIRTLNHKTCIQLGYIHNKWSASWENIKANTNNVRIKHICIKHQVFWPGSFTYVNRNAVLVRLSQNQSKNLVDTIQCKNFLRRSYVVLTLMFSSFYVSSTQWVVHGKKCAWILYQKV